MKQIQHSAAPVARLAKPIPYHAALRAIAGDTIAIVTPRVAFSTISVAFPPLALVLAPSPCSAHCGPWLRTELMPQHAQIDEPMWGLSPQVLALAHQSGWKLQITIPR